MTFSDFWEHFFLGYFLRQFEENSRHLDVFGSTFGPGNTGWETLL